MSLSEKYNATNTVALPVGFIEQVTRSGSVNEVLSAVAHWLPTMVDADRASIALTMDDRHLRMYAIQGNHAVAVNELLPVDKTVIGEVYESRTMRLVNKLSGRDEIDCRIMDESEMNSYLVVPLESGEECFGTLNIASEKKEQYDEEASVVLHCLANWIGSHIRIYRHIEHERELTEIDTLTELLNRDSFVKMSERVYNDWRDDGIPFIIAILDLDRFKQVNDRFGHLGGDRVLVEFAHELKAMVREFDHVARLGGEEFAIILENMHEKNAFAWAERLTDTIAGLEIPFEEDVIRFTVSVGIASPKLGDEGIDPILSRADQALGEAKEAGRNQVAVS